MMIVAARRAQATRRANAAASICRNPTGPLSRQIHPRSHRAKRREAPARQAFRPCTILLNLLLVESCSFAIYWKRVVAELHSDCVVLASCGHCTCLAKFLIEIDLFELPRILQHKRRFRICFSDRNGFRRLIGQPHRVFFFRPRNLYLKRQVLVFGLYRVRFPSLP